MRASRGHKVRLFVLASRMQAQRPYSFVSKSGDCGRIEKVSTQEGECECDMSCKACTRTQHCTFRDNYGTKGLGLCTVRWACPRDYRAKTQGSLNEDGNGGGDNKNQEMLNYGCPLKRYPASRHRYAKFFPRSSRRVVDSLGLPRELVPTADGEGNIWSDIGDRSLLRLLLA